jgi:peptidoglycan/LPS O-acetylase OafA/YrhL
VIYRQEIDGLRAIAVMSVVFFHAGFPAFQGGFVGVDVFFVISGYLIASLILREHESGSFSLRHFYERRARRILPALFLVIACSLPIALTLLPPGAFQAFSRSIVSTVLIFSNVHFYRESGYFDQSAELKPLLHTWSLSVEEQFYVVFPLAFVLVLKHARPWATPVLVTGCVMSLLYAQFGGLLQGATGTGIFHPPPGSFFLLPSRAFELLLGASVGAHLAERGKQAHAQATPRHQAASLTGLLMIAMAVALFDAQSPMPGLMSLVPAGGAALFILTCRPGSLAHRLCSMRPMVGLGLISYSLYLWHQPALAFARIAAGEPDTGAKILLIFALIGLSVVSWRYVEQPVRSGSRLPIRRFLIGIGTAAVALVVFGRAGVLTNGFVNLRTTAAQRAVLETAVPSPMRSRCHASESTNIKPADACTYFGPQVGYAVFGDSHAVELAYGLALALRERNPQAGLRHFSFTNCAPSFGHPQRADACSLWTDVSVRAIAEDPAIGTVVVSYAITGHLTGWPRLRSVPTPDQRAAIWRSYVDLLAFLQDKGKKVVLVLQAPEIVKSIQDIIFEHPDPATQAGIGRPQWASRASAPPMNSDQIPPGVIVVDPAKIFCDDKMCLATEGGTALYYDDNHMSVAGARRVADEILQRLDTTK